MLRRLVVGGLLAAGTLAAAFVLGVAAPFTFGAPDTVYVTEGLSFSPAQQPALHGLFFVGNALLIQVALGLGLGLTALLARYGLLMLTAAGGMFLAGVVGALLAVGGGAAGLTPDQRGGMALVGLTLGGVGGLMLFAIARDRLRQRQRAKT